MVVPFPMPLSRRCEPFDDPEWIFEFRHGGVRALAVIERDGCRFLSRAKRKLYGFRDLAAALLREVTAEEAVMDGELAVSGSIDRDRPGFPRRERTSARYYAFDLMKLDGEDLRGFPLLARKERLKRILPARSLHVLYVDHARGAGTRLFDMACHMDLAGIVAKRAQAPYAVVPGQLDWITIDNPRYGRGRRGDRLAR